VRVVRFSTGQYTFFSLCTVTDGRRMRFHLIDRIDSWEPGKSLAAKKYLALGEEYLADHFPQFPIMPGVLMLQACVEAAAWLWRVRGGFKHPGLGLRGGKRGKKGKCVMPRRRGGVAV